MDDLDRHLQKNHSCLSSKAGHKVSIIFDFLPLILITSLMSYMIQMDSITAKILPMLSQFVQTHFARFFDHPEVTFLLEWKLVYGLLFLHGLMSVLFYVKTRQSGCVSCATQTTSESFFALAVMVAFQSQLPLKFVFQWIFLYVSMRFSGHFLAFGGSSSVFGRFSHFASLGFAAILFLGSVLEHDFMSRLARLELLQESVQVMRLVAQDILVEYFPQLAF